MSPDGHRSRWDLGYGHNAVLLDPTGRTLREWPDAPKAYPQDPPGISWLASKILRLVVRRTRLVGTRALAWLQRCLGVGGHGLIVST